MSDPTAHGKFIKKETHTSRTSAYIQWGDSGESIGSCLLLNPGSADFENITTELVEELESIGGVEGIVRTDPTMGRLVDIVEHIYHPDQPNGRFHIYNLFSVQNSESSTALEEFDRLVESGDYDPASSLASIKELRSHPWILLGWGCNEDDFSDELLGIKSTWLNLIEESGIPRFGKKHPKEKGYYHPIYAVYRPKLIDELVEIYRETVIQPKSLRNLPLFQTFTVNEARPKQVAKSDRLDVPELIWRDWRIMRENPEDVLKGFPKLHLDPRFKLRAYQFMGGIGANGVVWAVPQDKELPHPADCEILDNGWHTPKPRFALDNLTTAIHGDRSPLSYLQASVFIHEIMEFGAEWHGTSWGTHRILPFHNIYGEDFTSYSSNWTMRMDEPEVWEPHFYYTSDGEPTIVFHTVDKVHPMTINRFTHTFANNNYNMRIKREVIATGSGGIIF